MTTTEDYSEHPMFASYDQLTVDVNGKEFLLTPDLLARIEDFADRLYSENEYINYYWRKATESDTDHDAGDPLLCIETRGPIVPWENLEEMQMEMAPTDEIRDLTDEEGEDLDNGNGTMVERPDENIDEDPDMQDYKMVMFPERYQPYPDPEDGDFETLPPKPEKFDSEDPDLVIPLPESERDERWETGEAITSVSTSVEWNLQARANSVASGSTEFDGSKRTDSHNVWEGMLQSDGCDVIAKLSPKKPKSGQEKRKGEDWYENKDASGTDVGNRWNL